VNEARREGPLWRGLAGALAFYVLVAVVVLAPLASKDVPQTGAQDLANHLSGIIEARNALAEGQFPIRVAPNQLDGARYPIFQFYGNLPYTAGALLYLAGLSPYQAWKGVMGGALVLGACFVYQLCRRWARRHWPALVAGVLFLTAPYTLCDVHGRVAYPETVSLGLLPVVFYFLQRALARPRAGVVLAGAACWSALALTHAVTYLCAGTLFGLYVLSLARLRWKFARRGTAALAAFALGLGLSAWYVGPQLYLLPQLAGGLAFPLQKSAWLTPLGVLLAPTVLPPVHLPTPLIHSPMQFGLQVGWPILAAVAVTAHGLVYRKRQTWIIRGTAARLVLFFLLVLFLVWSPVDVWHFLPRLFEFVQFSYRLLMFVVLFGSVLAGCALNLFFRGQMRFEHAVVTVLGLGLFLSGYLRPHHSPAPVDLDQEIARPNIGRGSANGVYQLSLGAIHEHMRRRCCPPGHSPVWLNRPTIPLAVHPGHPTRLLVTSPGVCLVELPVMFYPRVLDVRVDGRKVPCYLLGHNIALPLAPGPHEVKVRFVGLRWANRLSAACWAFLLAAAPILAWQRVFRGGRCGQCRYFYRWGQRHTGCGYDVC
jgi:hypothetical protein